MLEWTPDHLALVGDARLSPEAVQVGLLVALAGDEGLGYDELEGLMPDASRDRLRRAVRKLERCEWVARKAGGRAHGDRFLFLASADPATYEAEAAKGPGFRLAILANLSDRLPKASKVRGLSYPEIGVPKGPPPPPPPPPPVDARVREAVESIEELAVCRLELLAYLALGRVSNPDAYVRSVAGAIGEHREELWRDQFGDRVLEGRAEIIAGCLNELALGDEVGPHFSGPPGDFKNLAGKIRYRVKSIAGGKHDARRNDAGRGRPPRRQPHGPVTPGGGAGAPVRRPRRRHVEG